VISEQGDEAVVDASFKGNERLQLQVYQPLKARGLGLGGE